MDDLHRALPTTARHQSPNPPDGAGRGSTLVRELPVAGLTRTKLRGAQWQLVSRGLYGPAHARLSDPVVLTRMLQRVLPDSSGFGHLT